MDGLRIPILRASQAKWRFPVPPRDRRMGVFFDMLFFFVFFASLFNRHCAVSINLKYQLIGWKKHNDNEFFLGAGLFWPAKTVAKKIGSKHDHHVNFSKEELTQQPDHMRKSCWKKPISSSPSGQVESGIQGCHENYVAMLEVLKLQMSVYFWCFLG